MIFTEQFTKGQMHVLRQGVMPLPAKSRPGFSNWEFVAMFSGFQDFKAFEIFLIDLFQ